MACGGGILDRAENLALLKRCAWVVWLRVDPATAAARLGETLAAARPLLRGAPAAERLRALLEVRKAAYAETADAVVDTAGRAPREVAEAIALLWKRARARWGSSAS